MKRGVAAAALAGALFLAGCSAQGTTVQTVGPQEFLQQAAQPNVVTVDVRTPAEFAQGHVDGAVNISVEDPSFDDRVAALDQTKTYVVYCRSGNRSTVATDRMADAGFTSIYNLSGGVPDLAAAGAPITAE